MEIKDLENAILAREEEALQRWSGGDPMGFADIGAEDLTYCDPKLARPVCGSAQLREHFGPTAGKIQLDEFGVAGARFRHLGGASVLNYVFEGYAVKGEERLLQTRWHVTEIYSHADPPELLHSHWSPAAK